MVKYNFSHSVSWRDVVSLLRWAVIFRFSRAKDSFSSVNYDIDHYFPDLLVIDFKKALFDCERVFYSYRVFCEVRAFLRYKAVSPDDLGISEVYSFYLRYSSIVEPCSDFEEI